MSHTVSCFSLSETGAFFYVGVFVSNGLRNQSGEFMSSGFIKCEVVEVRALLLKLLIVVVSAFWMPLRSLVNSPVSMRLRLKRTCSGVVVCFGGFHIKRFSVLFLFLRVDLT